MKYCSKCGKENNDVSSFCTSCGTSLQSNTSQVNTPKQNNSEEAILRSGNLTEIYAKIDSLSVSESWKQKFRTIADTEPITLGIFPKFKNVQVYKNAPFTLKFNLWAFFFGLFYYLAKGMWKRGLVLAGVSILISLIVALIFGDKAATYMNMGLGALYGSFANIDYYRKMVLGEDFWV